MSCALRFVSELIIVIEFGCEKVAWRRVLRVVYVYEYIYSIGCFRKNRFSFAYRKTTRLMVATHFNNQSFARES